MLAIHAQHHYLIAFCLQASNNPEAHSYAAVMVIMELDDEGSISLDRSSFAPGLTERLI